MKNSSSSLLLLPLFLFLFTNTAKGQFVTIPDSNFRAKLQAIPALDTCFNALGQMDTTCTGVTTLTFLDVSGTYFVNGGITSLEGVQYFDGLDTLYCTDNQLATLPSLPNTIRYLFCQSNQITVLPNLPTSLFMFDCSQNQLTTLPTLPSMLWHLYCGNNHLTSLPSLNSNLGLLNCFGNQLTSLPNLPNSLGNLRCENNLLDSLPELNNISNLFCSSNRLTSLPNLANLAFLNLLSCSSNLLTQIPALPNSLATFQCDGNQLTNLPTLPNSLLYLTCSSNQLSSLPILPNGIQQVSCGNNNISCLPSLPNTLGYLTLENNHLSCIPNRPLNLYYSDVNLPVCQNTCTCGEYSATAKELTNWTQTPASQWKHKPSAQANGGTYWNIRPAIASKSVSDGAWVLDADSLHLGNYANPITAQLTSPKMNISSYTANTLFLSFHQYYRAYNSSTIVQYSLDHGTTWASVPINTDVPNHLETANYDYKIIPINIANAPSDSLIVRFNFSGHGYFWILDDIKLCDIYPSPTLPDPGLGTYLYYHNIPYQVDRYGHAYVPDQLVTKINPPFSSNFTLPNGDNMQVLSSCDCDTLHVYQYIPQASLAPYPSLYGKSLSIEEKVQGAENTSRVRSDEPNYFVVGELSDPAACGNPSNYPLISTAAFPNLALDPNMQYLIAILDTGIDPTTTNLAHRIAVNQLSGSANTDLFGINTIYPNARNNVLDDHGHGTHVAGIINYALNNYFQNTCNIKFKIIKTHDSQGLSTLFNSACGIHCAINSGAKVINCSWGYYVDSLQKAEIMYNVIKKAQDNGIMVVASAGNDGILVGFPDIHLPSGLTLTNLPAPYVTLNNVISAGSTNTSGTLSSFSNYSTDYVDIAAYGENISSNGLCGTTAIKSGTSMTTGLISAAVANRAYCNPDSSISAVQYSVFNDCAYPTTTTGTATGNSLLYECCSAALPALHITGNESICNGSAVTLTCSAGTSYLWSTGATTSGITVIPNTPTTYTVTASFASGCSVTKTASKTVTFDNTCPNFTPTIEIDNVTFLTAGVSRDFIINISEISNHSSRSHIVVKIPKLSGFTFSFSPAVTQVNGTPVNNSMWTKTETSLFTTLSMNPNTVLAPYSITSIGMTVTRNANVPSQTHQPITATLVNTSGGDDNPTDNVYTLVVKAQ